VKTLATHFVQILGSFRLQKQQKTTKPNKPQLHENMLAARRLTSTLARSSSLGRRTPLRSFSKFDEREKAYEDMAVKKHEEEVLRKLREVSNSPHTGRRFSFSLFFF
jgi:hypothetical protein